MENLAPPGETHAKLSPMDSRATRFSRLLRGAGDRIEESERTGVGKNGSLQIESKSESKAKSLRHQPFRDLLKAIAETSSHPSTR